MTNKENNFHAFFSPLIRHHVQLVFCLLALLPTPFALAFFQDNTLYQNQLAVFQGLPSPKALAIACNPDTCTVTTSTHSTSSTHSALLALKKCKAKHAQNPINASCEIKFIDDKSYLTSYEQLEGLQEVSPAIWKYTHPQKDKKIYITTSHYPFRENFCHLIPFFQQELMASDAIAVISNRDKHHQADVHKLQAQHWLLKDKQTLKEILPVTLLTTVKDVANSIALNWKYLNRYQPIAFAYIAHAHYLNTRGYSDGYCLDRQIIDWAQKQYKPVIELSSLEKTIKHLTNIPIKYQIEALEYILHSIQKDEAEQGLTKSIDNILKLWLSGNISTSEYSSKKNSVLYGINSKMRKKFSKQLQIDTFNSIINAMKRDDVSSLFVVLPQQYILYSNELFSRLHDKGYVVTSSLNNMPDAAQ